MKLSTKISKRVTKAKNNLIAKARKSGLYENFGDAEVRELKDEFDYHSLIYGSPQDRQDAKIIESFDNWCMNADLSTIK